MFDLNENDFELLCMMVPYETNIFCSLELNENEEGHLGRHDGFIFVPQNILRLFDGSVLYSYEKKETMALMLPKANIFCACMAPCEAWLLACVENHNTLNLPLLFIGSIKCNESLPWHLIFISYLNIVLVLCLSKSVTAGVCRTHSCELQSVLSLLSDTWWPANMLHWTESHK